MVVESTMYTMHVLSQSTEVLRLPETAKHSHRDQQLFHPDSVVKQAASLAQQRPLLGSRVIFL